MPGFDRAAALLRRMLVPGGIDTPNAREILRKLPFDLKKTHRLFTVDVRCPDTGNSLMHHGAAEGDVALVQSLLDFDAPADVTNNVQQSPLDLAQNHIIESSQSPSAMCRYQRIEALLSSRGAWQMAGSRTGLSMNRMMQLLDEALTHQRNLIQPAACLYGVTQAGKSTMFNWILGTDYELDGKGFVRRSGGHQERVFVGNNAESETLYPTISAVDGRSFDLVDMPGFEDGRGGEMALCVSASRRLLTSHLASGVQVLVLVAKYDQLCHATTEGAFNHYKKGAAPLGSMIEKRGLNNVLLLVSKAPKNADLDAVIDGLNCVKMTLERNTLQPTNPQYAVRRAQLYLTDLILQNPERHILMPNILNTRSRSVVLDRLASFMPHRTSEYELQDNIDEDMAQLVGLFHETIGHYFDMEQRYLEKRSELNSLKTRSEELARELAELRSRAPGDIKKQIRKLDHGIELGGDEIKRLTARLKRLLDERDSGKAFEYEARFEWDQDTEDSGATVIRSDTSGRAVREQTDESIVETTRLHERVYALNHFEIFDVEGCYEVSVGRTINHAFVPFVPSPDSHEDGHVTRMTQVKDLPEFKEAAASGDIYFRCIGAFRHTGKAGFSLKYSALRKPSQEVYQRLTSEIVLCEEDLIAEGRVLTLRKEAKTQLGNLKPDIESKEAECIQAVSHQEVAKKELDVLALALNVNREYFMRVQRLLGEYDLSRVAGAEHRSILNRFSLIDLENPAWYRQGDSATENSAIQSRFHTFHQSNADVPSHEDSQHASPTVAGGR